MNTIGRCAAVLAVVMLGNLPASAQPGPLVRVPYSAARVIRLAERGDLRSQALLGRMYEAGRGVPQDYYEAAKWLYRAADRGDPWSQFELGMIYNKGRGVRRDYVLAEMWLNLSASRVVGDNRDFVARIRDAIAAKMTAEQLATSQRLARAWSKSE